MKRLLASLLAWASLCAFASPNEPFVPLFQGTVTITAGTSSATTALRGANSSQAVVYNAGTAVVFFEFGTSGITAAVANGYAVGPGMKETVSLPSGTTHVATISGSASQTVYVSVGAGT